MKYQKKYYLPVFFALMTVLSVHAGQRENSQAADGSATVYLRGVPATASITINNDVVRHTFSEPIILPAGTVQLVINDEGIKIMKSFLLRSGDVKVINFSGNPDFSTIDVISEPLGAHVWLNDRDRGATPYLDSLVEPGSYTMTIKKYGYDPVVKQVDLLPQEEMELTFELTRSKAWLDSVERVHYEHRQKRRFVQRVVFSSLGIACAGAAAYFDLSARKNIAHADELAQTYDGANDGLADLKGQYYTNRDAARGNIKKRDISLGLGVGTILGFAMTFVF
jgi:hypothetical protein